MGLFKKIFGEKKKQAEIDLDQIGINLSERGKESVQKFISRNAKERLGDIMLIGDKGHPNFFYLMYYSVLFDTDTNVRYAALKRIPNFKENENFEKLIDRLDEPHVGKTLELYYSMMLFRLGKISGTELNKRMNNGQERNVQQVLKTVDEARMYIKENFKNKEENLLISDELNDVIGINMSIIMNDILNDGYMPDGFEQKDGHRIYKYVKQ